MAVRRDGAVNVRGLSDFTRKVKALGDNGVLQEELQGENVDVANLVVRAGKAHATTRQEARAAQTLVAGRGAKTATVTLGNAATPGALGSEFGAGHNIVRQTSRGPMRGWNQFQAWRGSGQTAGYFLYPGIRASTGEIVDRYSKAIERISKQAFPT